METPVTSANLQQFLCAIQWMHMAVPKYQEFVTSLHEMLEKVYEVAGQRKKRAPVKVLLSKMVWTNSHPPPMNTASSR